MATVTSAITMVTKPSIADLMTKSRQEEIKVGLLFSVTIAIIMIILQNIVECKDKFKFGAESKIQSNDMNNNQPTKVWRTKLVDLHH